MIRIEFESPSHSGPCPCCGAKTTSLTRFVYQDDDAYAIYYARFSDSHPDRTVLATVSVGEWGEGSSPEQRVAFALKLSVTESQYEVSVIDAEQSPWRDVKIIGRTLDREEALADPRVKEVFHLTDHMVAEDEVLKAYLDGPRYNA